MRPPIVLCLCLVGATAMAAIVEDDKPAPAKNGIKVPKSQAPTRLECWIGGRRQVVEARPAQLPPVLAEPTTQVLIRNPDGSTTLVVVPGTGASGCLPLR
jgi:hypothetical protein